MRRTLPLPRWHLLAESPLYIADAAQHTEMDSTTTTVETDVFPFPVRANDWCALRGHLITGVLVTAFRFRNHPR